MEVSISNVIINYFLLHVDENFLSYEKLQELINLIQQKFHITITDNDKNGIISVQRLCSDFLNIDQQMNLTQENILDYLEELQPIYQWVSFKQWKYSPQYYDVIRKFK